MQTQTKKITSINEAAILAGLDELIKLADYSNSLPNITIAHHYEQSSNSLALQVIDHGALTLSKIIYFQDRGGVEQLQTVCNQLRQIMPAPKKAPIIAPVVQLFSGSVFNLKNPTWGAFDIQDIAHSLAHICRFNGHTREFYSVAQHSVLVSQIVPAEHALTGLLHDAAEAFCGDVATPLKQILPDYQAIITNIEQHLASHIGTTYPLPECVKQADMQLLATEVRDLMPADGDYWACIAHVTPLKETITPLSPQKAKQQFLDRFFQLISQPKLVG
ncbi:YfbR-like 5'-deoxynucleotidase [Neptunicella sp.]|uniref:YfbR-like 5'-deoxynucleotidase n=1 Tax=Neptunicella sp. TaxID=2125986 RepID=UPI003F68F343